MDGSAPEIGETIEGLTLPDEAEARAALILALRQRGIRSTPVLSAVERLPRRLFLSSRYHKLAYTDAQLPIECGQTTSAPGLVALVVESLDLSPDQNVLEIGTGSGYQTAVLAHLARQVDSLDRYQTLVDLTKERLATLRIENARIAHADGFHGLRSRAPFDRIVATAAVDAVPAGWLAQLKPGGMLIAPVGRAGAPQMLKRFKKTDSDVVAEDLVPVRTVSMRPGTASKL